MNDVGFGCIKDAALLINDVHGRIVQPWTSLSQFFSLRSCCFSSCAVARVTRQEQALPREDPILQTLEEHTGLLVADHLNAVDASAERSLGRAARECVEAITDQDARLELATGSEGLRKEVLCYFNLLTYEYLLHSNSFAYPQANIGGPPVNQFLLV
jgi:hypothetical protein